MLRKLLEGLAWTLAVGAALWLWSSQVRDNDQRLTEIGQCADLSCRGYGCTGDDWRAAWDGCYEGYARWGAASAANPRRP